jgi:hypothetical protein
MNIRLRAEFVLIPFTVSTLAHFHFSPLCCTQRENSHMELASYNNHGVRVRTQTEVTRHIDVRQIVPPFFGIF